MEISYLCAARQANVLELRWMQFSDKGIFIQQGKTGKKQIKVWTPHLRKALEIAQAACPKLSPDALVLYNVIANVIADNSSTRHSIIAG